MKLDRCFITAKQWYSNKFVVSMFRYHFCCVIVMFCFIGALCWFVASMCPLFHFSVQCFLMEMNVSWVLVMISAHALFLLIHLLPAGGAALPAWEEEMAERETVFFLYLHLSGSVYTELLLKSELCVWDDKAFARRLLHCLPE